MSALGPAVLALDCAAEVSRIGRALRHAVSRRLRKRGVVLGVSGGVDSSVCAALAARALGPERVLALLMPEADSSPESLARGRAVVEQLAIPHLVEDIAPVLASLDAYGRRDRAIRQVFPEYGPGWRNKIVIGGEGGLAFFRVVVESPDGTRLSARLPHRAYLEVVAATNFKQRVRKMLEYHHADRLNFAVLGTPNLLEHDQGFFVKGGDGAADVKPIAHLYKTQVYALARHLGLPREVCEAEPTTDTYSLEQGQDEFFFGLRYPEMDLALYAERHALPPDALAEALGVSPGRAARIYRDIRAKRRAAAYLHAPAITFAPGGERP